MNRFTKILLSVFSLVTILSSWLLTPSQIQAQSVADECHDTCYSVPYFTTAQRDSCYQTCLDDNISTTSVDVCNDACSLYTGQDRQNCVNDCRDGRLNGTIFGQIETPPGVTLFNAQGTNGIGLIPFISNLIKLATIVAGLWVMINIILAGYIFITSSGDSSAYGKVKDKITMSVIGLIIIVAAYTITALVGLLFFGDAGYILSPNISGPTSTTTP